MSTVKYLVNIWTLICALAMNEDIQPMKAVSRRRRLSFHETEIDIDFHHHHGVLSRFKQPGSMHQSPSTWQLCDSLQGDRRRGCGAAAHSRR